MLEYRITKYNPTKRNEAGHYLDQQEWTDFGDVGKSVTLETYEAVESAYIASAIQLISYSGASELKVTSLEHHDVKCSVQNDQLIPIVKLKATMRAILRNEYWCRLESDKAFIHFGYDYYMYIGVCMIEPTIKHDIANRGLFVEDFISPYHPERE